MHGKFFSKDGRREGGRRTGGVELEFEFNSVKNSLCSNM